MNSFDESDAILRIMSDLLGLLDLLERVSGLPTVASKDKAREALSQAVGSLTECLKIVAKAEVDDDKKVS